MNVYEVIEIMLAAGLFGGILYWTIIGPRRAQRQRRKALGIPAEYSQAWDPRLWSGRRNR